MTNPPANASSRPEPVLGTMTFGDTVGLDNAALMLDTALESGVTGVDTANAYAGGACEQMLRELLPSRRDRIVLATKAGMPHPDAGEHAPLSAKGLRACLEGSLKRLGVDHVDLFHLHQPDRATPLSETLSAVAELTTEGKIGALGVSNFAAWQIAEINRVAAEMGAPLPRVAQQLHSLLARRLEDEYTEFATVTGLRTMIYNPLAGGLLTGRHSFNGEPDSGRFGDSRLAEMYRKRYWDATLFDAVERLRRIADDAGLQLSELALRWLASRPSTDAVLLGGSKVAHLRANLDCLRRGALPADVMTACDEVGSALRGPMPAYNR